MKEVARYKNEMKHTIHRKMDCRGNEFLICDIDTSS